MRDSSVNLSLKKYNELAEKGKKFDELKEEIKTLKENLIIERDISNGSDGKKIVFYLDKLLLMEFLDIEPSSYNINNEIVVADLQLVNNLN